VWRTTECLQIKGLLAGVTFLPLQNVGFLFSFMLLHYQLHDMHTHTPSIMTVEESFFFFTRVAIVEGHDDYCCLQEQGPPSSQNLVPFFLYKKSACGEAPSDIWDCCCGSSQLNKKFYEVLLSFHTTRTT
jgi:hypothetical protein